VTAAADDPRITNQEKYLKGVVLSRRQYRKPRPDWDHDHCEFCWTKFMETSAPGDLSEGYATPGEKHWVCPKCFEDFKGRFGWTVP